jgi:hypothetical protein
MATVEERFWRKVDKREPDECWPWTGAHLPEGYGLMYKSGRPRRWHRSNRLAYELLVGPIPDGLHVLHRCDNPPCCNPAHLFLGTQADNNRDRDQKGRNNGYKIRGAANGRAKLMPEQVAEIRRLYAAGGVSQQTLADRFGVKQPQISRLVLGLQYVGEE